VTEPSRERVRYRCDSGVAHLTLDHPPVNVLSREVLDELITSFDRAEADGDARVVILESANPKAFAAGADIRAMASMGPAESRIHGRKGQEATERIEACPLPVIASVHGSCLGGGSELVLACDFVLASEDAIFGQPEIKLGVMPGWGGTQRLPRRIGAARAREWILTGRAVPAREAAEQGLVLRVVPRTELATASQEFAVELGHLPSTALAAAKYALNRAIDRNLESGLTFELELWHRLFATADQKEGMQAFLEKRAPRPAARRPGVVEVEGFPWEARKTQRMERET
jgi:enoyl-CoA hydratase